MKLLELLNFRLKIYSYFLTKRYFCVISNRKIDFPKTQRQIKLL